MAAMPPVRLDLQPATATSSASMVLNGHAAPLKPSPVPAAQPAADSGTAGRDVEYAATEGTVERAVRSRGAWYMACSQVGGAVVDHAQQHPTLVTWGIGSVAGVVIGHVALRYARNR